MIKLVADILLMGVNPSIKLKTTVPPTKSFSAEK